MNKMMTRTAGNLRSLLLSVGVETTKPTTSMLNPSHIIGRKLKERGYTDCLSVYADGIGKFLILDDCKIAVYSTNVADAMTLLSEYLGIVIDEAYNIMDTTFDPCVDWYYAFIEMRHFRSFINLIP